MKKVKSLFRYPRFINKLWADFYGYFWLPCPICERNFGGHESDAGLLITTGRGLMVCWRCNEEARIRNESLLTRESNEAVVELLNECKQEHYSTRSGLMDCGSFEDRPCDCGADELNAKIDAMILRLTR